MCLCLCNVPFVDLASLTCILRIMAKFVLKEVNRNFQGVKISKSCSNIWVWAVMVTLPRSFSACTNAVTNFNDCLPDIILSGGFNAAISRDKLIYYISDVTTGIIFLSTLTILLKGTFTQVKQIY